MQILRDKMATMQYELMEGCGTCRRDEFPYGDEADKYWKDYIDGLMAEVKFYDYEVELHTKYRPKGITSPKEAFSFMRDLEPKRENLFLYERRTNMSTHFLDYKNRVLDLREAEKGAREEKEKALLMGDKEAAKRWEKAEENAKREANKLEKVLHSMD